MLVAQIGMEAPGNASILRIASERSETPEDLIHGSIFNNITSLAGRNRLVALPQFADNCGLLASEHQNTGAQDG